MTASPWGGICRETEFRPSPSNALPLETSEEAQAPSSRFLPSMRSTNANNAYIGTKSSDSMSATIDGEVWTDGI